MEEQRALADTKARVVSAQRDVTVAEQEARAAVARADGEAGAIRKIAEANAARETLVGMAQAGVLEAKVNAIGPDNWTTMEVITNLAEQHVPIVPQVVAGSGDGVGSGNVAGALLGVLAARMLRQRSRHRLRPRVNRLLVDGKRKSSVNSREPRDSSSSDARGRSRSRRSDAHVARWRHAVMGAKLLVAPDTCLERVAEAEAQKAPAFPLERSSRTLA